MENTEFFSIQQAADYLGFNHHTIRRAIKRKDLPAYQVGGKLWRIKREDLEEWIIEESDKTNHN